MELENQVCSLELAEKLKSLGVKQESLFYRVADFILYKTGTGYYLENGAGFDLELYNRQKNTNTKLYSAFTVAELGEMLPTLIKRNGFTFSLKMGKSSLGYFVHYGDKEVGDYRYFETEANARAKMLIYLIENKLITL